MANLHAHEAGNGGQSQGKPTVHEVLFYSESTNCYPLRYRSHRFPNLIVLSPDPTSIGLVRFSDRGQPTAWKQLMRAEVDCQTEAEFYFGGLTEDGKKKAAQKIADKTCFVKAKELGVPTPSAK